MVPFEWVQLELFERRRFVYERLGHDRFEYSKGSDPFLLRNRCSSLQDNALTGTNTLANTDCLTAVNWLRCGAYQVRIRPDVYQGGYNLAKAVVCHETGHTIGLLHGSQTNPQVSNKNANLGCMRTEPLTGEMRFIGEHNLWEADRMY